MKLKTLILISIVIFSLISCYPLVSPVQPRVNPNDSDNYVPVAENFTATYNEGLNEIYFSWTPLQPEYEYSRDGYLIVRKTGSYPTSVYDGYPVGNTFGPDDASGSELIDTDGNDDYISGAQAGYTSYYGLFAYSNETQGGNEINIAAETYTINNTEGYVFSGPVTASVSVPRTVQLDITEDCHIDEFSDWNFDGFNLNTGYNWTTTTPTFISIIVFDTSSLSDAVISEASFTLTNSNSFSGESPRVDMITEDWDSAYNFSQVREEAFGSTSYSFTFEVAHTNSDDSNTVSDALLVDIVQKWADGTPNYGLRIMNDMGASDFTNAFHASESGVDVKPVLEVTYTMQ